MLTHLIQSYGYLAVFVLMTLESVFIPIPSEITMPFAGYLASQGALDVWIVIFLGALGNLAGSLIGYAIGHSLEENVLRAWVKRRGKYLLVREKDYDRALSWFSRYGNATVFFSRLLPAIRTYISLPAGIFEMRVGSFSLYTFLGSLIWSGMLAFLGYFLGVHWQTIEPFFKQFQYLIIAIALIAIIGYVYRRLRRRKTA